MHIIFAWISTTRREEMLGRRLFSRWKHPVYRSCITRSDICERQFIVLSTLSEAIEIDSDSSSLASSGIQLTRNTRSLHSIDILEENPSKWPINWFTWRDVVTMEFALRPYLPSTTHFLAWGCLLDNREEWNLKIGGLCMLSCKRLVQALFIITRQEYLRSLERFNSSASHHGTGRKPIDEDESC